MGLFSNKRSPEFEKMVDMERDKIRKEAFSTAAKMDAKTAVQKEVEDARFAALPRYKRAQVRADKIASGAKTFFGSVGMAANVVSQKLDSAERKFNQKAEKFNGQNSVKGQKAMGGSLGESLFGK